MADFMGILLKITLVIFMVGNLLDMGLRLQIRQALSGLRNVRFVIQSALWGFVLCPALAYLLTKVIPLEEPYAVGMILLGMAPCAPFLPVMADRARADLGYAVALMLLASVLTALYMPVAVPLMTRGLTADAWAIAKPLVYFLVVPLVVGAVIRRVAGPLAARMQPIVKRTTGIDTLIMLVLCAVIYGKGFAGAVGSYAFATQILFFSAVTVGSYALSFGLSHSQRSILALGMSTRNAGAALAPLFAVADVDPRAIVMVVIGVPMQTIAGLIAANWLARRAAPREPDAAESGVRANDPQKA